MRPDELKHQYMTLAQKFNRIKPGRDQYELSNQLLTLATRYHTMTGIWLKKPPRLSREVINAT